jgi:hypothetical protein
MARISTGAFTHWELTDEEQLRGAILNGEQKQFYQNERCRIGLQLLALKLDPLNPLAAVQEQAHMQGQLDFCTWMLETSEISEKSLLEILRQSSTF